MNDQAISLPKQSTSIDGHAADSRLRLNRFSDEALIEQLKQGNHDAFALLFARYHRLVHKVCFKILHDPSEAEDLVQDVFFEIYRVAAKFNSAKGSAKSWILQYAYHRSLNRRRYLELRKMYGQDQISQLDVLESYYSPNDGNSLCSEELAYMLQQGLETLGREQRETLELACFQGASLGEIAKQTGKSLVSVQHYYYRGLKKLREFLQGHTGSAER